MILNCFSSRDKYLLFTAFTTYVRPTLEYCCNVWSPYKLADIRKIESIQRKFTKRLTGLQDLSYQDRLTEIGAESLQIRRIKFDLTMYYKILHSLVDLEPNDYFGIKSTCTRGNDFSLLLHKYCSNIDKYTFKNRVLTLWNLLPNPPVSASSLSSFKNSLDSLNLYPLLNKVNWVLPFI